MQKALKPLSLKAFVFFYSLGSREGGIRTPGSRKGSTVFKTAAFDRSATSLRLRVQKYP